MVILATLKSTHGNRTLIEFEEKMRLETLAQAGRVDAYIASTEDGFSPLGANLDFLSKDLGIPSEEISRLANWNRFKNSRVSLIALRSRRNNSLLRGVILAASESSECYKRFAAPYHGRPYRDFYYNVTYEAITFACGNWEAHHLAISHLSACGAKFHEDIAMCNSEALAHYCDVTPSAGIESFIFCGCCISPKHLVSISRLNADPHIGRHKTISAALEHRDGYDLIHLAWIHNS